MNSFRDGLKNHYNFLKWKTLTVHGKTTLCQFLPEHNFNEYYWEQRQALPNQYKSFIDFFCSHENPKIRIALTVMWYITVEDAHEGLIDVLANCMHPNVPRLDAQGRRIGDIGFGNVNDAATDLFFTRGNVLIRVQSVGNPDVSVTAFAETIDEQIVSLLKSCSS
jgi:hypothetical protein